MPKVERPVPCCDKNSDNLTKPHIIIT